MKYADYCYFYGNLIRNGQVTFNNREELIAFFAEMMANIYLSYVVGLSVSPEELYSRKYSDPIIVRMTTQAYLNHKIQDTPKTLIAMAIALIVKFFGVKIDDVKIDLDDNNDLYNGIVKSLNRKKDSAKKIFEQRIRYTINSETLTLERSSF